MDNLEYEDSIQKPLDSVAAANIPHKKKINPMTPSRLEYAFWSTHRTEAAMLLFALCTSLAVIITVLIVCLTSPKATIQMCELKFNKVAKDPIEYDFGPQSVTIGDLNNDKRLDIVVANRAMNSISVFLASIDGTFKLPAKYPTGIFSTPNMVAVGDLNNDHRLDIIVANFGTNSIGLFFGFGNGSFSVQILISTGSSRPRWIHLADLDNDTLLDIVIVNYGTNSISILYGDGNGNFLPTLTYSTGYDSLPFSVISGDFDNDHHLDLAVANYGTNSIGILLANNNRTFSYQNTFTMGKNSRPYAITVGDFNNDLILDIAVANNGDNSVGVLLGDGNGIFAKPTNYFLDNASPYSIDVGDLNGDNRLDLVVTNSGSNNIGVLLGHGNGMFSQATMYSTGSSSSVSVAITDFNNDNQLDVVVVNNDTNSINILSTYDEGFLPYTTYSTGSLPTFLAIGDLNNDGILDIIVTNSRETTADVFLGYNNGSFGFQLKFEVGIAPSFVAVGDFNTDNRLDIVVAHYEDNNINIFLGCGNGSFEYLITYVFDQPPSYITVGDFNNDTHLDIVVAGVEDGISILLGYGNGYFVNHTTYRAGPTPNSVGIGDFNNDTQLDIVVIQSESSIGVLLGYGDGYFADALEYEINLWSFNINVGDFNNDQQLDIVIVDFQSRKIGVLLGYGNGSFGNPIIYSNGYSPAFGAVGDFNNDNYLDLIVTNTFYSNLNVLLGSGNGSFFSQITYSTGSTPSYIAASDFNNDNHLDIVVSYLYNNSMSVFLQSAKGSLRSTIALASSSGSRLQYIAVEDINNDALLDIVVVNYGTNDLGVLFGYQNGTFQDPMMFSTGVNSNPYSIAIGDFNQDKKLDFAIANYGTKNVDLLLGNGKGNFSRQTPYGFGLDFAPITVATGDLNHDGQLEIVVAYNNTNDVDILVVYDTGSFINQTTYLTGSYPNCVAVGDFNNDNQPDIVVTNSGNDTVSVLLGYSNGSFTNSMMFDTGRQPQFVVVGDFNTDMNLDIVVVNNNDGNVGVLLGYGNGSFANQITYPTGRFPCSAVVGDINNDTHLDIVVPILDNNVSVLLGYGNGSFANRMTFYVGYSPNSVAIGDFNNDIHLDIVVSVNDGNVSVLLGYGNGSFADPIVSSPGIWWFSDSDIDMTSFLATGDVNKDNHLDVITVNNLLNNVIVLLGYGNGSFSNRFNYSAGFSPGSLIVVDLNNDTVLDIVVGSSDILFTGVQSYLNVFLGNDDGSFRNQTMYSTGHGSQFIAVGNFNNDTKLDLVVTNQNDGNVSVLFGDFNRVFKYEMTLANSNGSLPRSFVIGDFNNDIHMDIGVLNSGSNNIGIFLGYGNGSFTNQLTYSTGSFPWSIALGDFNNDSHLDIVVTNANDNTIGILLGYGNGSFMNQMTYSTGFQSQPYSVAVGDFNNDNLLDIIVANHGTKNVIIFLGYGNGTFTNPKEFSIGYESSPFLLVVGDFNNDAKLDFAVANYETDDLEIMLQTC